MKIGIDTNIFAVDNAGSAVYARQLIMNLKEIDRENSYEFFSFGSKFRTKGGLIKKVENIVRDIFWMQITLPKDLVKKKVDILHCLAYKAPLKNPVPLIVTFLDIHIIKRPQDYSRSLRSYCKFMLPKIAKAAKIIITLSESSKRDIVEALSIPEEKIAVTYCGVDKNFHPISDIGTKNELRQKYNLHLPFILYIGAIQPRKNIYSLLKAYSELKKKKLIDYQLIFVGGTGWQNKNIFRLVKEIGLSDDIKFLGYIPEAELPFIYNLAEFFVYPSFYEGFGLPVLEAMACGCPVITTNTSSLPEIVGDAAIMVNPYNINELENAMSTVASDSLLRQRMKEKGIRRAKSFSWERCARETLEIYSKVLA